MLRIKGRQEDNLIPGIVPLFPHFHYDVYKGRIVTSDTKLLALSCNYVVTLTHSYMIFLTLLRSVGPHYTAAGWKFVILLTHREF